MNYQLNATNKPVSGFRAMKAAFAKLYVFMADEKKNLVIAAIAIIVNSGLNLLAPLMVGHAIDTFVVAGDYPGLFRYSALLLAVFAVAFVANYVQMKRMGGVGQRVLFRLRNTVFTKLQELPVAFFNQNKIGDLISRINNDTDKLNQFFSETLMRFIGSIFVIIGSGIFIICIKPSLGAAGLIPAAVILLLTHFLSAWIRKKNAESLKAAGTLSAEVQENLNNFKVIVAFDRRDYFRIRFGEINKENFKAAIGAGLSNGTLMPTYDFLSNAAQLIVLGFGIYLISRGHFTIGLLISFLIYIERFYTPLRHMAALWSSFQVALAGWERVRAILELESNLPVIPAPADAFKNDAPLLEFKDVHFHYPDGQEVLRGISFALERGKTYALVGPTGGGKTTTASLMARLYDPTSGQVLFNGRDIRSYAASERADKIGFILQDPILFSGTIRDNIFYGNEAYANLSAEEAAAAISRVGLDGLLARFEGGLEAPISAGGDGLSLGQKQLIAFMRAVLRQPELLILDEATANIDTVTESLLGEILDTLPATTTRVVIAHRLNTIENADEIFFVNSGAVTAAGSMEHAVEMLLHHRRSS